MPEFNEEIIPSGGANTDDEARFVPKGDYRDLFYSRLGDVQGKGFCVVTSKGTRLVENDVITDDDVIIGACEWAEQNAIIYFVKNTGPTDQIWVYFIDTETHELAASTGFFNFDPAFPIFHANMLGDICKWTDGRWDDAQYDPDGNPLYNGPRQLNIRKALNGDYTGYTLQTIDAIKWPPPAPTAVYVTDDTHVDNKLGSDLYFFRVQWIYENNEPSVLSHYSDLVTPINSQYISGNNVTNNNADNRLDVTFQTGPNEVKKINVAYSKNNGPWVLYLQIDKSLQGVGDNTTETKSFFGNVTGKPIETDNYDNLPRNSFCQDISPNKEVMYVNNRFGFDKIEIDIDVTAVLTEILWSPVIPELIAVYQNIIPQRIYFEWADNNTFTVVAGQTFTGFVTIISESNLTLTLTYTVTQNDVLNAGNFPTPEEQMGYILEQITAAYAAEINAVSTDTYVTQVINDNLIWIRLSDSGPFNASVFSSARPTVLSYARESLKTGMNHQFAIEYYDKAERTWTIQTMDSMNIFVPSPPQETGRNSFSDVNLPYLVWPKFTINNAPPVEADYYRIMYKTKGEISASLECTLADITLDNNRYRLTLDFFAPQQYRGFSYDMTPAKGDILRPIRKQPNDSSDPDIPYLDAGEYFELEILEYSNDQGIGGNPCVWVPTFTIENLFQDGDTNNDAGQLIEIIRLRPTLDDEGNLFTSEWRVASKRFDIGDAHSDTRYHGGSQIIGSLNPPVDTGSFTFDVFGQNSITGQSIDYSFLVGWEIYFQTTDIGPQDMGIVTAAIYDSGTGITTITTTIAWGLPPSGEGGVFIATANQDVALNIPAVVDLQFGNIWVRQREMTSSYPSDNNSFIYWIESFQFDDYNESDIHDYGEYDLEDPYARLVHKMASAIRSGTFIDNSQVNGSSTFRLNLKNTVEMRDEFGPVNRVMMNGKTLKCLQTRKENSIYLEGILSATGDGQQADLSTTQRTFNQSGVLPFSTTYGCQDPDSVVLFPEQSTIVFWDRLSGSFIASPGNGQTNLSKRAKYVKKSLEIRELYNTYDDVFCRSFVNELMGEIGWCFSYNNETQWLIVTFDYVTGRFRSTYDYNFRFFANIGQYLVGWGKNNQLYVHNQESFTFHGQDFFQKITLVSNEEPMAMKRYQDMVERSDRTWSVRAYTEPNQSYALMETAISVAEFDVLEGYSKADYMKNRFTPDSPTEEYALMNGEDMRAYALTHELRFNASENQQNSVLFSIHVKGVISSF